MKGVPLVLLMFAGFACNADELRARENYILHCQGCHLADAAGFPGKVPRMKDYVGYFLYSKEGREFLVRVPGVATSTLPDDQVAELMNWLLVTYSANELPDDYRPYSVDEVAVLRARPEQNPDETRTRILGSIAGEQSSLAHAINATDQ